MNARVRSVGAVIAGVVGAYVVITLVEFVNTRFYPMPAGVNLTDEAAMRAWVAQLPPTAFAVVLVGWALGALVGGMIAAKLAPSARSSHALIVGALLLAAGIANMWSLPHPVWMWVAAFLVFVPLSYFGARFIENRTPSPASI